MTDQVDILEIQLAAEKVARDEYQQAYSKLEERASELRGREKKWAMILGRLNALPAVTGNAALKEVDLEEVLDRLSYQVEEYAKLQKMFDLINSNELLSSQWKRLVASIRLVGGDEV